MALDITQLTPEALVLLTAVGWSPDRHYDATTCIIEPLTAVGWPIFPEAQRIFETIGMLRFAQGYLPPDRTHSLYPAAPGRSIIDHVSFINIDLHFDPYDGFEIDHADFLADWITHPLVAEHGGLLCPIGSCAPMDPIFVCADGLVCHGSFEYMYPVPGLIILGDQIETALNLLAYDAVRFGEGRAA
ncbi:hypothetical protein [Herpetosiphon sp. NSE202]|uniref:hypothetical protein n=1 Tax=Herpetosiphon sp. NSE202 TaxID=3351349 RepID=UPI003633EB79